MKTLVYGAGALGSLYAAKLHQAGVDVSILERGQRLADLREHGVVLEDVFSGTRETHRVPVVEELGENDPYDLILVLVRKDHSMDILPVLARNRRAHTVLFLQNNPGGSDDYIKALGSQRVMAGFPTSGGERRDPVMRVMLLRWVPMPIGEVDGSVTDRTRLVAALLRRTGKRVEIRRDMDAWLVTHVTAILDFLGAFTTDLDPARFARTRDAMLLAVQARAEALQAQQASNVPISPAWFKGLPYVPEPLAIAMLWGMAQTSFFRVGVAGLARDESAYVLQEYRQRISQGGVPTPKLDRLMGYIDGTLTPLSEGSREVPIDWRGIWVAAGLGAFAAVYMMVRSRRR
jgi:ketopantoate reductase